MASVAQANPTRRIEGSPAYQPVLDWLLIGTSTLFIIGLFLDGWAHNHGKVDDTFFTVWHAVMYGAFGLVGLLMVSAQLYYVNQGYRWTQALPKGYFIALIGVLLFVAGGAGDMFWHETFGVEANLEALFSPSHLLLALSAFFFISAPLTAAWSRREAQAGWKQLAPVIVSASLILSLLSFFTQYNYMVANGTLGITGMRQGDTGIASIRAVTSSLLATAYIMGILLFLIRRWRLPFGSMTVIVGSHAFLMTWLTLHRSIDFLYFGGGFIVIGLVMDMLLYFGKPSVNRIMAVRIVSFLIPFAMILIYMLALHLYGLAIVNRGLWWTIHMWLGLPVICGFAGLFMSYLTFPPTIPENEIA